MRGVVILAGLGAALALTGYSMMRVAAARPEGNVLLGAAIAFVGVALIFIAAVRAAL